MILDIGQAELNIDTLIILIRYGSFSLAQVFSRSIRVFSLTHIIDDVCNQGFREISKIYDDILFVTFSELVVPVLIICVKNFLSLLDAG